MIALTAQGSPTTSSASPSTTAAVDLVEANTTLKQVAQVVLSNTTSSAVDVSLIRTNGVASTNYLTEKSIPANDYLVLDFIINLPKDFALQVQDHTGGAIVAHAHFVSITHAGRQR